MKRAGDVFAESERNVVRDAIARAEQSTSAEIVVVAATRSGRYDRAEDLFGLAVGLLVTGIVWLLTRPDSVPGAQWSEPVSPVWHALLLLLVFIVTLAVATAVATRVFWCARFFLTRNHMLDEVKRSAVVAFQRFRIARTADGTGMLIYLSLAERMVWVVGDDVMNEKIDPSIWEEARDNIVAGFRSAQPVEGLVRAIVRCGEALAEALPVKADDVNELPNELIVLD